MEYANLGNTGIKVSRICLGTVFRSDGDEWACRAVIARALDLGCNFIDCANVYRDGLSEQFVGRAIRGRRHDVVLATKVGAVTGERAGGLSRAAIIRQVEASLARLGTDYIDLYSCHFPDPLVKIEETVRALDELVGQGKVRHIGCSNFAVSLLSEALAISERDHLASFVSNQVMYNLLSRQAEDDVIPFAAGHGVSITAFAPTMIGLLSGHCRYGQAPPPGSPWDRGPYNYRAVMSRHVDSVIAALIEIAGYRGKTPIQVALAWCLENSQITSVIVGADKPEHIDEDFGAAGWHLTDAERDHLNRVSAGMRIAIPKDAPDGFQPAEPWT
jgi:aryl-alcohol dehydrogenase-like predicted oxidoreductase